MPGIVHPGENRVNTQSSPGCVFCAVRKESEHPRGGREKAVTPGYSRRNA